MANMVTKILKILTLEAASFCSRAISTNANDPHTGLSPHQWFCREKGHNGDYSLDCYYTPY